MIKRVFMRIGRTELFADRGRLLFVFVCLGTIYFWYRLGYYRANLASQMHVSEKAVETPLSRIGTYGDSFGMVTSLFTALGFCGVVYTIYLQRKDARESSVRSDEMLSKQLQAALYSSKLQASSAIFTALAKDKFGHEHERSKIRSYIYRTLIEIDFYDKRIARGLKPESILESRRRNTDFYNLYHKVFYEPIEELSRKGEISLVVEVTRFAKLARESLAKFAQDRLEDEFEIYIVSMLVKKIGLELALFQRDPDLRGNDIKSIFSDSIFFYDVVLSHFDSFYENPKDPDFEYPEE